MACAAAKPAYNYQEPQTPFLPSASFGNGGSVSVKQSQQFSSYNGYSGSHYAPQSQYVSSVPQYTVPASAPAVQPFYGPAPQYVAPVQHQGGYTSGSQSHYQKPQQQEVIVNKEIFIHSAPEETEVIGEQRDVEAAPIRKNYRIVFIKAPTHNVQLNLDALKHAQAANEEKTVIYVLSKKPDFGKIQSQLVNVQSEQKTTKPEVFFIKYKTQEEAIRAQQEIQSQYDALGGSTRISDEGIAPVTSVIGGTSAFGNSVNIGSVGSGYASAVGNSVNYGSVISPRTVSGGSNFVQTVSSNQEQFAQKTTQSTAPIVAEVPTNKYLPVTKKK